MSDLKPEANGALREFGTANKVAGSKGKLSVALHITRLAIEKGLPIDSKELITEGKGQLKGIGAPRIKGILADYGITQRLASEAGRTSRGSLGFGTDYAQVLNTLKQRGIIHEEDLGVVEKWWIEKVKEYFEAQPFKLKFDTTASLRTAVLSLLKQAQQRQQQNPGTHYVGIVLQHLVGAKLALALPKEKMEFRSASTADEPGAFGGDYELGDSIIHVTTAPSQSLLRKCAENLSVSKRPIIVTIRDGVPAVANQAKVVDLDDSRVEVFEAEQFLVMNICELGQFSNKKIQTSLQDLVARYNKIVEANETDASLRIEIGS